ncbi:hypothetical protein GEMRC1_012519 [Eukaryota sp. GEM-RC1]
MEALQAKHSEQSQSNLGLNELVNSLKEQILKLTDQNSILTSHLKELTKRFDGLAEDTRSQRQLEEMKAQNAILNKEIDQLKEENNAQRDELELVKRSQLDFDPKVTKILSFKESPVKMELSKKRRELEEMRNENLKLREIIDELQVQSASFKPVDSSAVSSLQNSVNDLTQKLSSSELKYERLKTVFHQHVRHYREAVTAITGWQVDLSGDLFTVRSLYSEDSNDYFAFESPEESVYLLVETEVLSKINPDLVSYLQKFRSIPGFLAQVTMDLLNKQTLI